MKKALYAFAVVALMAGVSSCSSQATEEVKDSVVVEEQAPVVEEPVTDTAVVVDSAAAVQ